MQMAADLLGRCHHFDQLIRQILRMGGHETDPFKPLNPLYPAQKFCKGNWRFQVLSVGIDILP